MRRRPRLTARWRRARWLQVAALVGAALVAIGGGYLFGFVLTRPAPSPTPSPSLIAGNTPVPTLAATATPSATTTATATPSATPTATATPRPTGPPPPPRTPPPTPSLVTGNGVVSIRFTAVALADRTAGYQYARSLSFVSDRAGEVRAELARTTGGAVEVCLVPAAPGETPNPDNFDSDACAEVRDGGVSHTARAARQDWTVTLRAAADGTRPITNLTIRFPAATATLRFANFAFNGMEDRRYNGIAAEFPTSASGRLRVAASWHDADGDNTHDWAFTVTEAASGSRVYRTAGTGSEMDVRTNVPGGRILAVRLENREFTAADSLVSGLISWP